MLFNSLSFLIFFPVVTFLYFVIPHRYRWLHLLAASCVFYMFFIPVYIFILVFTIVVDYTAGILIENAAGKKRKMFLLMSIAANVGTLAVFKYYNFFIDVIQRSLLIINVHSSLPLLALVLPIGLSFHTFQAMSYTIEVYRGKQRAERHFGIYALYVMFYPQLVAGPIERPQHLLQQFREEHWFQYENLHSGIRLMMWGLFKKVCIADRLALYVNAVYEDPGKYHPLNMVLATLFFSFQIYCDFSGYSDIAIGAARSMGFSLMTNFQRPYFAQNIKEFWSRWHISLSTWFRDYLYIPLGGNRVKVNRLYFNLAVVFIVSGLWHGANATFLVWGMLHAGFVIIYMIFLRTDRDVPGKSRIKKIVGTVVTFNVVTLAWVFFRSSSVGHAIAFLKRMVSGDNTVAFHLGMRDTVYSGRASVYLSVCLLVWMFVVEKFTKPDLSDFNDKFLTDVAFGTVTMSLILMVGIFNQNAFIYFQF